MSFIEQDKAEQSQNDKSKMAAAAKKKAKQEYRKNHHEKIVNSPSPDFKIKLKNDGLTNLSLLGAVALILQNNGRRK